MVKKMAVVNVPVLLRVQRLIDLFIFDNKFDHKTLKSGNFVNNLGKICCRHFRAFVRSKAIVNYDEIT